MWPKFFLTSIVWFLLFCFFAMYTAYLSVILIWCILGAVLNPEQFLPIAAGSLVIIGFALSMIKKLKSLHKKLKEIISEIVTEQLKTSLVETLEKQNADFSKLLEQPVKKAMQGVFFKSFNSVMDTINIPRVDKITSDEIIEGNGGTVARIFNKNFGIDYHICLGIVGLLNEDSSLIIESVINLSKKLELNDDINILIAHIAISQSSFGKSDQSKLQGDVMVAFKNFFRKAFPKFPLEAIDRVLKVVLEFDYKSLSII